MYDKRVKIFIAISLALLAICVLRLAQMQLLADSKLQDEIAEMKRQSGRARQLKTVRGRILDRDGNVVAVDTPRFQICINYELSSFLDDRVVEARKLAAAAKDSNPSLFDFYDELETKRSQLMEVVIRGCAKFGMTEQQVWERINAINDDIWNLRAFLAWRSSRDPNSLASKYNNQIISIPFSEAMADFSQHFSEEEQLNRITRVSGLPEMSEPLPLVDLKTDDDVFAAQVEFMDLNDVQILPTGQRRYPYGSVASQTIGWVGLATQKRDTKLFEDDPLASYRKGEMCGREDGVEYVCESVLRGRRGEVVIDIDRELVRQNEPDFGDDVVLTLDVELQKKIEQDLADPKVNPGYHSHGMAAVAIDVGSGDILALVSMPTYDLNRARYDYGELLKDPNMPVIHRAINKQYLPGSCVKPVILIAAMEAGLVTAEEEIECPSHDAPQGWPNCLIWRSSRVGHSSQWTNNARNALKGSCNIYFSRLADRFDPPVLQRWLFRFGYGRPLPLVCPVPLPGDQEVREMRQSPGQISTTRPTTRQIQSFDDIPPLRPSEKANFGIGHGNLWATPLQVANAFATIARDGLHKPPRLFLQPHAAGSGGPDMSADLGISAHTLAVVRDGMSAVVNESGGTAHDVFAPAGLSRYGVHVYGKTGSTERPDNASFAGFIEDTRGRKIALAVVVEGGQHGSSDAAPLACRIMELCIDAGYIGNGTRLPSSAQPASGR
jgi:penicillin-binding protein 2